MSEMPETTVVATFTQNGAVFEDKNIAICFPKTPIEAQKLLEDNAICEFLATISESNVLKVLGYLVKSKHFATIAAIANKCKINESSVSNALVKLKKYMLVNNQSLTLDHETVEVWRVYRTHSLLFVYAIMQLGKRATITEDNYLCYHGNDLWCY